MLEYAQNYISADNPYEAFLEKVASCLKSGGKLYIAIENKLGMKYFAGCSEDHLGIPLLGLKATRHRIMLKLLANLNWRLWY